MYSSYNPLHSSELVHDVIICQVVADDARRCNVISATQYKPTYAVVNVRRGTPTFANDTPSNLSWRCAVRSDQYVHIIGSNDKATIDVMVTAQSAILPLPGTPVPACVEDALNDVMRPQ